MWFKPPEQLDVTAARISHSHPTEPTRAAGFEGLGLEKATKVPRAASPAAEMRFARPSLLPSCSYEPGPCVSKLPALM